MRTLSLRLFALLVMAVLLPLGAATTASAATADSAPAAHGKAVSAQPDAARSSKTKCVRGSSTGSGICYKYLASKKQVVPVEAVPLRNRSSRTATLNCNFTRTITKSTEYGASATSSGEVSAVFGLAKLSLSVTVSKKVTQTESQASSAGGSVTLKPGQSVSCLRTYGMVKMTVQRYTYSGTKITSRKNYTVTLPAYLGVDIVD